MWDLSQMMYKLPHGLSDEARHPYPFQQIYRAEGRQPENMWGSG